ncbi:hypothetical protein AA16663_0708 [Komagataeibacter rhaeticus DSM 16663]|nr:hypothetical protein AA16663_0708 [Komagataeibacter rhaeticus DSM 16663]
MAERGGDQMELADTGGAQMGRLRHVIPAARATRREKHVKHLSRGSPPWREGRTEGHAFTRS